MGKIETWLVFHDEGKKISESLDEFVPLKEGDAIKVERDIGGSFPGKYYEVERDKVRKGRYIVRGISREYRSSGLNSGTLKVEYTLKRFSKE